MVPMQITELGVWMYFHNDKGSCDESEIGRGHLRVRSSWALLRVTDVTDPRSVGLAI